MKCERFFEIEERELTEKSFLLHLKECQACQHAFRNWEVIKNAIGEITTDPVDTRFQKKVKNLFIPKRKSAYVYAGLAIAAALLLALLLPKAKPPVPLHKESLAKHIPLPQKTSRLKPAQPKKAEPHQEKEKVVTASVPAKPPSQLLSSNKRMRRRHSYVHPRKKKSTLPVKRVEPQAVYEEFVIRVVPSEEQVKIQIETGEGAYLESKGERSFEYATQEEDSDLLFPVMAKAGSKINVKVIGKTVTEKEFQIEKLSVPKKAESPVYPGKVLSFDPIHTSTEGNLQLALGRLTPQPITVESLKGALKLKENSKLVFPDMEVSLSSFQILPENGEG